MTDFEYRIPKKTPSYFISESTKLDPEIIEKVLVPQNDDPAQPLSFTQINVALHLKPGTKESIAFHVALDFCTDDEVFKS